jgi:hypothetical protein
MKRAAARAERARAAARRSGAQEHNKLTSFLGDSRSRSRGAAAAAARAGAGGGSLESGAPRLQRGGDAMLLPSDANAGAGAEWDVRVDLTPRRLHPIAATHRGGGGIGSSAAAAGGALVTLHGRAPSRGRTPSQLQNAAPTVALEPRASASAGESAERPRCDVQAYRYISSWGAFRAESTNNNKLTSPGWFYKVQASEGGEGAAEANGATRAAERGPFTAARMSALRRRRWIHDHTLVRRGDEEEWVEAGRSEGVRGKTFL